MDWSYSRYLKVFKATSVLTNILSKSTTTAHFFVCPVILCNEPDKLVIDFLYTILKIISCDIMVGFRTVTCKKFLSNKLFLIQ